MSFFKSETLIQIKKNEIGVKVIKKFFDNAFINELKKTRAKKLKNEVNRADSIKSSFKFNKFNIFKELKKKIESLQGNFYLNDFSPHFITSKFPLRIHADTGKDSDDIIGQNILIPIEIFPAKKNVHTIIFKNRWYGPAAYFTKNNQKGFDHILQDTNNKFIDIKDVRNFYKKIIKIKNGNIIKYKTGKFLANQNFKDQILKLIKSKRYNIRTNEHIKNGKKFNKKIYNKYLSHQPYEDLTDLKIKTIYKWEIGDILIWDRSLIHASDNYLANGVIHKTAIPLFTSHSNRPTIKKKGDF